MADTAKLFINDNNQAVRLPAQYRFEGNEVYIRRDAATGDVILSRRPDSWSGFFALDAVTQVPADFMSEEERRQERQDRDPFDGVA